MALFLSLPFTAIGAAALSAHGPNNNKVRPVPGEDARKTTTPPPKPTPKPTSKPTSGG